jgi:hypothetical protein
MSAFGVKAGIEPGAAQFPLMTDCVAKLKNEGLENSAIFPSKWIFGNTMPCNEPTKAPGWKSDCSCDPLRDFRANAPAPLEKFARTPKKSFATQSTQSRYRAAVTPIRVALPAAVRTAGAPGSGARRKLPAAPASPCAKVYNDIVQLQILRFILSNSDPHPAGDLSEPTGTSH